MTSTDHALGASCVSPPTGLVGWWSGDGTANDIVGSNNGVLQSGATANGPGVFGSGFHFDGTNSFVQIPDAAALRPTNLTVEGWVRFDSLNSVGSSAAGQQFIVFKQNTRASDFEGFNLSKDRRTGGDFLLFGVTSAAGQAVEADSVSLVSTGVWYHVAGVRGSNFVALYLNGHLEAQAPVSFAQSYGNFPLYFGTSGQPSWDHKLAGSLDEVSLYNRALSSNEIAAIYAAGAAGKCKAVSITVQPQDRTVGPGVLVSFPVTATGSTPLYYQWQRNGLNLSDGGNVTGASSSSLDLANAQTNDSASYRVIITNLVNAVTSTAAALVVDGTVSPPIITSQPASQTLAAGVTAIFTVGVSGSVPLSYQWRFNGTNLANGGQSSGVTSSALSLGYVFQNNAGNYSVVITNGLGAVTSAIAALTVVAPTNCLSAPAGLVGWWPADANGKDIIGTNDGILQGGATAGAVPGFVGSAFHFDGTNGYVQVNNAPELNLTNLTIECWVQFDTLDTPGTSAVGAGYIAFKQNTRSTSFEGINLSKHRYGSDIFVWEATSAAGYATELRSLTTVSTNVWYHLAGVRGPDFLELYVNGLLEVHTNVNYPQDYANLPLYFGTSGQAYWDHKIGGSIDEISLYNRALSASEIAVLYAAGTAGKCKAPNIVTGPQSQSVAVGANAVFSVSATGIGPFAFQWQFNSAPLAGATGTSLTLTNVQLANGGNYRVAVSNSIGSTTSAVAVLTVGQPLVITAQPQSRTNVAGSVAAFSVTASGTPPLSYQWRFNGGNLVGASNSNLALSNVQPADAGNYTVLVTNLAGAATSAPAILTVLLPPSISAEPQSRTNVAGTVATFSVTASGTAPLSYQWRFNGANLVGASNSSLSLSNVQPADAGNYSVQVTNLAGSATSAPAILTVLLPPFISVEPQSRTNVAGTVATFSLTASGSAPLSYQWRFNGGNLVGASNSSLSLSNVQPADAGNYTVQVTNLAGAATSAPAILTVLLPPSISAEPQSRTNVAGTVATFSVTASGAAPLSYQWQFNGAPITDATSTTLALTSVQSSDAGNYRIVVTNLAGTATSAVAILTVLRPPSITLQPVDQTVLTGSAVSFSISATGDLPLSYQWRFNGTDLPGAQAATLSLTNAQPAQSGNYQASVSNAAGITNSALAVLTVLNYPSLQNARLTTNGSFACTLVGNAGYTYFIEAATNLIDWIPAGTVSNATGVVDFFDSISPDSDARFYRARLSY